MEIYIRYKKRNSYILDHIEIHDKIKTDSKFSCFCDSIILNEIKIVKKLFKKEYLIYDNHLAIVDAMKYNSIECFKFLMSKVKLITRSRLKFMIWYISKFQSIDILKYIIVLIEKLDKSNENYGDEIPCSGIIHHIADTLIEYSNITMLVYLETTRYFINYNIFENMDNLKHMIKKDNLYKISLKYYNTNIVENIIETENISEQYINFGNKKLPKDYNKWKTSYINNEEYKIEAASFQFCPIMNSYDNYEETLELFIYAIQQKSVMSIKYFEKIMDIDRKYIRQNGKIEDGYNIEEKKDKVIPIFGNEWYPDNTHWYNITVEYLYNGDLPLVKEKLKNIKELESGNSIVMFLYKLNHLHIFKYLVDIYGTNWFNIESISDTIMYYAADSEHVDFLEYFWENISMPFIEKNE